MWTFFKYIFYILILIALFYIGKAFYDSNLENQTSDTIVITAE